MTEPIAYLVAHLHEALLTDDRLHEQAIEIVVVGDRLQLRGEVATPERRAVAVQLARDLAPGIEVVDDLRVSRFAGPDEPEPLRASASRRLAIFTSAPTPAGASPRRCAGSENGRTRSSSPAT